MGMTGAFPFNKQPSMLELFYTIAFVCVIFIIMVNTFLLAVVVAAYDGVATAIKDSVVEQNVFLDVIQSFQYFYFRFSPKWKWPDRALLVSALAAEDFDEDNQYDGHARNEELYQDGLDARIEVTVTRLVNLKNLHTGQNFFRDEFTAKDWVDYYLWITPCVGFGYETAKPPMLMHQQDEVNMTKLAWITSQMIDGEHSERKGSRRGSKNGNLVESPAVASTSDSPALLDVERKEPEGEQSGNHMIDGLQRTVDDIHAKLHSENSSPATPTLESLSRRVAGVEGQLDQILAGQIEIRQMLMKLQRPDYTI